MFLPFEIFALKKIMFYDKIVFLFKIDEQILLKKKINILIVDFLICDYLKSPFKKI